MNNHFEDEDQELIATDMVKMTNLVNIFTATIRSELNPRLYNNPENFCHLIMSLCAMFVTQEIIGLSGMMRQKNTKKMLTKFSKQLLLGLKIKTTPKDVMKQFEEAMRIKINECD